MTPLYKIQPAFSNDTSKMACCEYIALRDCVATVNYFKCSESSADAIKMFFDFAKEATGQCDQVQYFTDCTNLFVLWIILIIVFSIIIGIISGICKLIGRIFRC